MSKGLCIGGPKDGQVVESKGDILKTVIPEIVPFNTYVDMPPDTSISADIFVYEFYPGKGLGLWIPIDKDLLWATEQLTTTYMEAKRGTHCKYS